MRCFNNFKIEIRHSALRNNLLNLIIYEMFPSLFPLKLIQKNAVNLLVLIKQPWFTGHSFECSPCPKSTNYPQRSIIVIGIHSNEYKTHTDNHDKHATTGRSSGIRGNVVHTKSIHKSFENLKLHSKLLHLVCSIKVFDGFRFFSLEN